MLVIAFYFMLCNLNIELVAVAKNRHGQSDGQTASETRQSTATSRGQGSQNRKLVAKTVK